MVYAVERVSDRIDVFIFHVLFAWAAGICILKKAFPALFQRRRCDGMQKKLSGLSRITIDFWITMLPWIVSISNGVRTSLILLSFNPQATQRPTQ
jgi:hypothetical protein